MSGLKKSFTGVPALCVFLFVFVLEPVTVCSEMIVPHPTLLNFDKLFPQTPMQVVLESCMRIQHELLWQVARDHVDEEEAQELVDLIVGRLYHVRSCVQEIVTSSFVMQEEDLMYFFSLLETIIETYQKLMKTDLPAHGKHALALLSDIKTLLDTLTR